VPKTKTDFPPGGKRGFLKVEKKPKSGVVTIAGHPGVDIPKGTLNSIFKQAGLKP
jgi:predicted RNA binding protein YcfA (HicA-like mRNA interferase family)